MSGIVKRFEKECIDLINSMEGKTKSVQLAMAKDKAIELINANQKQLAVIWFRSVCIQFGLAQNDSARKFLGIAGSNPGVFNERFLDVFKL